ncbi:MAG: NUMOD4 domain-containing protein [Leifsonia sp.]
MESYFEFNHKKPELFGPFLERWIDIKGFEGKYFISDYGRINSIKNGILKCNIEKNHYTSVTLIDALNNKLRRVDVHILVCEHFLPNPENKLCVNHKLGFKNQNFVGEIEWCTYSENAIHAFNILGVKANQQEKRKNKFICTYSGVSKEVIGVRATARALNIPYQAIQRILNGTRKTYNGFTFNKQ